MTKRQKSITKTQVKALNLFYDSYKTWESDNIEILVNLPTTWKNTLITPKEHLPAEN